MALRPSTRPLTVLRRRVPSPLQIRPQSTSSSFFPVSSSPSYAPQPLPKPQNTQYYTSRPSLHSTLTSLQSALTSSRAHLFRAGLLPSISSPLSEFSTVEALQHPRERRWKERSEMAAYLGNGTALGSSQYKRLTGVLGQLEGLVPYAELADRLSTVGGVPALELDPVEKATSLSSKPTSTPLEGRVEDALGPQLQLLLRRFTKSTRNDDTGLETVRISGKDRRLGQKLPSGLIRAVGRRKESAAQVWIVPVLPSPPSSSSSSSEVSIPGRVLVNSLPLPTYFPQTPHRSSAILPLSLTGALGSFNVFAIAKGGGLAAQAEAVAMGLARGLVEWERTEVEEGKLVEGTLNWREVLKRAKLLERDPRMVERKKTGQPKARKKNTWVKR